MEYRAPFFLFHPHMETIYPAVMRPVRFEQFERERIDTPDGDFLDIDWSLQGSRKLVILCHGLEGNSKRPYMRGMARHLSEIGFDILSWNYRGCSGEINNTPRYYHSGATDDLEAIIDHAIHKDRFSEIHLVGFSLGGNLVLKYLGEEWPGRKHITSGVAISVPVDLEGCSVEIHKSYNWLYSNRFLVSLKKKVKDKSARFPEMISDSDLSKVKTLRDFDDHYTAPLHGFRDSTDYYQSCSSVRFLENIDIPVLIINAENDSFLSESCYPEDEVRKNRHLQMLTPSRGGHVGFTSKSGLGTYWSEIVTGRFLMK